MHSRFQRWSMRKKSLQVCLTVGTKPGPPAWQVDAPQAILYSIVPSGGNSVFEVKPKERACFAARSRQISSRPSAITLVLYTALQKQAQRRKSPCTSEHLNMKIAYRRRNYLLQQFEASHLKKKKRRGLERQEETPKLPTVSHDHRAHVVVKARSKKIIVTRSMHINWNSVLFKLDKETITVSCSATRSALLAVCDRVPGTVFKSWE